MRHLLSATALLGTLAMLPTIAAAQTTPVPSQDSTDTAVTQDDTANAAGNGSNTGCQATAHVEEVCDRSVRRAVEKGTAQATEHRVCQHDLIISCVRR